MNTIDDFSANAANFIVRTAGEIAGNTGSISMGSGDTPPATPGGTGGSAGAVTFHTGKGTDTSGTFTIQSLTAKNDAGIIKAEAGEATDGVGGKMAIKSGQAGTKDGAGDLTFTGGSESAGPGCLG
mgnify:CR=1 FL=1